MITEWFIAKVNSSDKLNNSDPIAIQMEQPSRVTLMPPLTVNTYQAYQGSVESEFSFQVNIKIEQNRLYFNKSNFTVTLHLGCYELTFLKPKLLKVAP